MIVSIEKFKAPAGGRGIKTTPEREALFKKCLDEGWSFMQIQKTHNVSWHTLNKLFPGQGMDPKVAASKGGQQKAANGQPGKSAA